MAVDEGGTVKHAGPKRRARGSTEDVLIMAYPAGRALPLPTLGAAVGRGWLAKHGRADSEVSGKHFVLERGKGALSIRDVGSSNGTFVDGRPVGHDEPRTLADGAVVRVGTTVFVYREALRGGLDPRPPIAGMVGPYGLRRFAAALEGWAKTPPNNVLIFGETGTGKELAARAVAQNVGRGNKYIAVNVAGVAENQFESQLFGYVRGAFTGADQANEGLIVGHDGGAIFLDEIGELPLGQQAKLLRVLENREVLPVGGKKVRTVDVVIVGATNRDLEAMVEDKTFRRDLLARFAVAQATLPPLRDRAEDVWAIAMALAQDAGLDLDEDTEIEVEAVERLMLEAWPNNVRDLRATLARVAHAEPEGLALWALEEVLGPRQAAAELDAQAVEAAVAQYGSEGKAAKELGISRGKLRRLLGKA